MIGVANALRRMQAEIDRQTQRADQAVRDADGALARASHFLSERIDAENWAARAFSKLDAIKRIVTVVLVALVIGACADDIETRTKPDAGTMTDACDPTVSRTCMPDLRDAGGGK